MTCSQRVCLIPWGWIWGWRQKRSIGWGKWFGWRKWRSKIWNKVVIWISGHLLYWLGSQICRGIQLWRSEVCASRIRSGRKDAVFSLCTCTAPPAIPTLFLEHFDFIQSDQKDFNNAKYKDVTEPKTHHLSSLPPLCLLLSLLRSYLTIVASICTNCGKESFTLRL